MEFKRNNSDRNSDCFIRRLSMCDNFFCKPLIVYKISSKDSLENTKQAIKILITKKQICNIFIENDYFNEFLDILNNEQYKEVANKLLKYNKLTSTPDLCIVIGGDGTVLWSHSLFGINNRPPFLTFNMGTLGYLAYYNCKLMQEIFIQVFDHPKNELIMEKRSTLMFHKILKDDVVKKETDKKTLLLDSSNVVEGIALNDLVINRESQRAIILDIFLNCTFFTTIRADGIIVSTSTGSTAYSLSAGGSIVHYDVDCLLMSCICPHSLSFRPIVFPKDMKVQILLNEHSPSKANFSNDGIDKYDLEENEGVEVSISDSYLNIIVLEKFLESPLHLWVDKMVQQLGWNNAFKNIG